MTEEVKSDSSADGVDVDIERNDSKSEDSSGLGSERTEMKEDAQAPTENNWSKSRRASAAFIQKYFMEGQTLNKTQQKALEKLNAQREALEELPLYKRILIQHRRPVALIIPGIFFHIFWWAYMIRFNKWSYFNTKYFMSITMVFGSMIAGMTSEGGGAIAFPVMTLAFSIAPSIARDFSMMIQSCGMMAAAFTIFFMRVQLEWRAILLCTLGGAVGCVFGLHLVDPHLKPPQKKMGFVSIWFAFASVLFLLNRFRHRRTFPAIPLFNIWKGALLLVTGFVGGIFTSFSGSGLDICSFAILTLLFRVTEKTATPTSVVLMGLNSVMGFYWRDVMMHAIDDETWEYLLVCIPVVVIGAPLGSLIGSHFHRLVLAALVCVIDLAALIGAFSLVPLTTTLIIVSVSIIVGGLILFVLITGAGQLLLKAVEKDEARDAEPEHDIKESRKEGAINEGFANGSCSTTSLPANNSSMYLVIEEAEEDKFDTKA